VDKPRDSYPLSWPTGRSRTPAHKRTDSRFKTRLGYTRDDLMDELGRMDATGIVLSSNLRCRNDGLPFSNQPAASDPGIAVYFRSMGKDYVFACDKYKLAEDNMRAIFLTIQAIRGIKRWGSSEMMEAAFRGFTALPAAGVDWRIVLGLENKRVTFDQVREAYRTKAIKAHPDHGGNQHEMMRLNEALSTAKKELAG
jgi:hypothetical protein